MKKTVISLVLLFLLVFALSLSASAEETSVDLSAAEKGRAALIATGHSSLLHFPEEEHEKVIAIGQKAAHYFATDYFVNIVQNGGYYGFTGISAIASLIEEAALAPKDRRKLISHKGIGCESCI